MYQDFKDLLSAFRAPSVKYLIVGGYAVSLHGSLVRRRTWIYSSRPIPRTRKRSTRRWSLSAPRSQI